jgi:hypothetical protein
MSTEPGTPASVAPIRKPVGRERSKPYLESYSEARELGRVPELYVTPLGTLKLGATFYLLF